jgi:predicted nucleic acid-binding protein
MKFYLDTSVFGGLFDEEFKKDTSAFFKYMEESNAQIIYSDITITELEGAPKNVKDVIQKLEEDEKINIIRINLNDEAGILAKKYIEEGALTKKCEEDAIHIALASIHGEIDALVSWNFKHMVNFIRIKQYNYINQKLGYKNIDIRSPKEIIL